MFKQPFVRGALQNLAVADKPRAARDAAKW
jgi:hypothetical protein